MPSLPHNPTTIKAPIMSGYSHARLAVKNKRVKLNICLGSNNISTRPLQNLWLLLRKKPRVARPYYLNDNHTLNNNIYQKSLIYLSLVFSIAKKKCELSDYNTIILHIKAALKELCAVLNLIFSNMLSLTTYPTRGLIELIRAKKIVKLT